MARSGTPGRDLQAGQRPGDESCPECGAGLRTHARWRGLDYGLRPGRVVIEQTCPRCGLLRVRVMPTGGGDEG
ncbi:MAG TPA: hypothetical protein VFP72_12700 [Kineosporiaceae bacterium]|nr:hypothetical protein [Kineosporiaceae bacterium]